MYYMLNYLLHAKSITKGEASVCVFIHHAHDNNLAPLSTSWWYLDKSVSGVSPSIPSMSSNGTRADSAREKAECLNSVFASKSCVPNPSLSVPILPCRTQHLLHLKRCNSFWKPSTLTPQLDRAASAHPKNLLCCSCTSSFCPFHPVIYHRSSSICLAISQHHSIT